MTLSGAPVSSTRLRVGPWVAYAAALWALVFAAFHIVWAAGWLPAAGCGGGTRNVRHAVEMGLRRRGSWHVRHRSSGSSSPGEVVGPARTAAPHLRLGMDWLSTTGPSISGQSGPGRFADFPSCLPLRLAP